MMAMSKSGRPVMNQAAAMVEKSVLQPDGGVVKIIIIDRSDQIL
jgi:hypothetical protein